MTTIEKIKKAGICFNYSDRSIPELQIPSVVDVLYVLQLSGGEHSYAFGVLLPPSVYVINVYLVAAAIGLEVESVYRHDKARGRKIVAQAIIDLCPEEARCLFNKGFISAKEVLGEKVVQPTLANYREILCSCTKHRM